MKLRDWLNINKNLFWDNDLRYFIKNVFPCNSSVVFEEAFLDDSVISRMDGMKEMYAKGVPLAYILGKEEFFGREFKVRPCVLIPRPETELIVEKAIEVIKNSSIRNILDLGCGCGNIGINIKKEFKERITVFAADISLDALELARENARCNSAEIKFINTDLFTGVKRGFFDLIVSNPPYVESEYIGGRLNYEPRAALDGGRDGLYVIRKILEDAPAYLEAQGYLIMEMGYAHRPIVDNLIDNLGVYEIIDWIKDYSGYWRGVVLRKRGETR